MKDDKGFILILVISALLIWAVYINLGERLDELEQSSANLQEEQYYQRLHWEKISGDFYGNCEQCHDGEGR